MSKHTPGPWSAISSGTAHNEEKHTIRAGDGTWIAETIPHQPKGCSQEANARLIAAAPELLDAVKDLIPLALEALQARAKLIDSGDGIGAASEDDDADGLPANWELRNRLYAARAAIAKAEGK